MKIEALFRTSCYCIVVAFSLYFANEVMHSAPVVAKFGSSSIPMFALALLLSVMLQLGLLLSPSITQASNVGLRVIVAVSLILPILFFLYCLMLFFGPHGAPSKSILALFFFVCLAVYSLAFYRIIQTFKYASSKHT